MLLPSDVARLVLGYLQQEKLTATSQAFIVESPNLKEYAEHCSGERGVPACLLSLFGKSLTSILNEYVNMKAKETMTDVPTALTSLWKKLDVTLSQIRSLQPSTALCSNQTARTKNGIAGMRQQRRVVPQHYFSELPSSNQFQHLSTGPVSITPYVFRSSVPQTVQSPVILGHLYTQECRPVANVSTGSTLQVVVPKAQERRPQSSLLSPGRRKGEPSKKMSAGLPVPHVPARNLQLSPATENGTPSLDDLIEENFPQMVIANATEKILRDKSLQEKLADTINKVLVSDSSAAQLSKQAPDASSAQEQSYDEILGLQSEIHMSEEAIQDILDQTESDPAFQDLFDLFDYGKKNKKDASSHSSEPGQDIQMKSTVDDPDQETIHSPSGQQQDSNIIVLDSPSCSTRSVSPLTPPTNKTGLAGEVNPSESVSESVTGTVSKQLCSLLSNAGNSPESSQAEESSEPKSDCIMPNQRHSTERTSLVNQSSASCSEKTSKACSSSEMETDDDEPCVNSQNVDALQQGSTVQVVTENKSSTLSKKQETSPLVENTENEVKSLQQDVLSPSSAAVSNEIDMQNDTSLKVACDTETAVACELLPESRQTSESSEVMSTTVLTVEKAPVCSFDSEKQNETEPIRAKIPLSDVASEKDSCSVLHSENSAMDDELSVEIHPSASPHPETKISEEDPKTLYFEESFEVENIPPLSPPKGATSVESTLTSDLSIEERSSGCCSSSVDVPQSSTLPHPTTLTVSVDSNSLSTRQPEDISPSKIVSLKIIISDPEDSSIGELKKTISSDNAGNIPTVVMSSPAKTSLVDAALSQYITVESSGVSSSEKTEDSTPVVSDTPVSRPSSHPEGVVSLQSEESNVLPSLGMDSAPLENTIIQVMTAGSTAFRESDSILVVNCLTDSTSLSSGMPHPTVVMLPSSAIASSASASQQLSASSPGRNTVVTVSNPVAKGYSQGSTFIISAPVQPVLQGMVGMIPVSLMGQSAHISLPQVLQMQAAHPLLTSDGKLPIPARYRRPTLLRSSGRKSRLSKAAVNISSSVSGLQALRPGNVEKSDIAMNSTAVAVGTTTSPLRLAQSHRRVLSFDESSSSCSRELQVQLPQTRTEDDRLVPTTSPASVNSKTNCCDESRVESIASLSEQLPDCETTNDKIVSDEICPENTTRVESLCSTSANKENEMIVCKEKQKSHEAAKILRGVVQSAKPRKDKCLLLQDCKSISKGECNLGGPNPGASTKEDMTVKLNQSKSKRQSVNLTSPLTKQAAEMLEDMRQSPAPKQVENIDLKVPRNPGLGTVDRYTEDTVDSLKTPGCKRLIEEGGTPRRMVPSATPDLPTYSPVSETGSENSVNMAAHTLMILSRATVTDTASVSPLKDNTQQLKSTRTVGQKRKFEDSEEDEMQKLSVTKDLKNSVSPIRKMKAKKQKKKKLLDSFPTGLDVDKFLSSLHYDE